jgi:hypothetical protein
VLGGRLLATKESYQEEMSDVVASEQTFKQEASISLGIKAVSISGGYSSEQGYASSSKSKQEISQSNIDWQAYGGNEIFTSKYVIHLLFLPWLWLMARPDKWLDSLNDYHYWEVVKV